MSDSATSGRPLEGRVALVTGGTRGIGRAIVEALLDDGAAVAFTGRDAAKVEEIAAALEGARARPSAWWPRWAGARTSSGS